jgi:hypothetical protein
MSIRCGSVAGVSLVLAAAMTAGAWAQDAKPKVDARAMEKDLRDAKNALQAIERGQLPDSPAVVEAKAALAKAIDEQTKKRQADRAAKPGIADLDKKVEALKAQQKETDGKLAEARKKLDADAELTALKTAADTAKKAADDAMAAYRAKAEEKAKADQAIAAAAAAAGQVKADMAKAQQDAVMLAVGDSAEYKALKAKVSELDAKIADAKKAEEAAKAERETAAKEKAAKKAEKQPEAKK